MPQEITRLPPARIVVRCSVDFILRAIRSVSRHFDSDLLEGLVILALLQREYAHLATTSPDSAERNGGSAKPISVKSLARSLKTPPETMRRCVGRLIAKDWCARMGRPGVAVSHSKPAQTMTAALMTDIRSDFTLMLGSLKSIDFDFDLMDRGVGSDGSDGPSSAEAVAGAIGDAAAVSAGVDRAILNFGLRIVDCGTTPFGNDYVLACVFSAIMSANAAPYAYDPKESWRYSDHSTPPPDSARRPATLAEISQILGMPYETARRHVNKLIGRGVCSRDVRKGLLIPIELMQSKQALTTGMEIVSRFVQVIGELKHLGFDFAAIPPNGGTADRAGTIL